MNHWKKHFITILTTILFFLAACTSSSDAPVVGFVDAFEDSTIAQAKRGFFDALEENGFSEADKTVKILYRNAQGDIPTLTQIVRYFAAQQVSLIAASATLSAVTAIQNTRDIPIFMMVAPTPELMKVLDAAGKPPANLFGVADNLAYIDTSFALIARLVKPRGEKLRIGLLYNQSEPQSVKAYERLQTLARAIDVVLVARPVNATADAQLVAGALLNENLDAFFANPDNTVFGAFETILKSCNDTGVPVFTSEAGLVARGAVAAYGADLYQWGYQAGIQAANFLKTRSTEGLHWEIVNVRKRVYNPAAAQRFGITVPDTYEPVQ